MSLTQSRQHCWAFVVFLLLSSAVSAQTQTPASPRDECPCCPGKGSWWFSSLHVGTQARGCNPVEATGACSAKSSVVILGSQETDGGCPYHAGAGWHNCSIQRADDDFSSGPISSMGWLSVTAGTGGACEVEKVGTVTSGDAGITQTDTLTHVVHWPMEPYFNSYSLGCRCRGEHCCEGLSISGFASPTSASRADLDVSFQPNCQPTTTVTVTLERAMGGSSGSPAGPSVCSFRTVVTMTYSSRATQTTTLAGVAADVFDGSSLSSIRLGVFDSTEFNDDPLPDGQHVSGTRSIEILPPVGDVTGINALTFSETFTDFDCDINADGAACPDDRDVMLDLVAANATLGDADYTARADFDLNGAITSADLAAFDIAYAALPDCNANGIPDGCDLLQETSLDDNVTGVPDECEKGDMNCDKLWNTLDIKRFTLLLIDSSQTPDAGCDLDPWRADFDGDDDVDFDDIGPFLQKLVAGGP